MSDPHGHAFNWAAIESGDRAYQQRISDLERQVRELTTAKETAEAKCVALVEAFEKQLQVAGRTDFFRGHDAANAMIEIARAALTPDLAALVAQHKAGQRAVKALGAIAAAVVTEDLNEVYYQCYKALVGDLALPADTQREIMREAMQEYLRADSKGMNAG